MELSQLENVHWCEISWTGSVLCLLSKLTSHRPLLGSHRNFHFGVCWTIFYHTCWARVEQPHQTCFNKSSPKSLAKTKASSLSQREDNMNDQQAHVRTHSSGLDSTAGHSSRVTVLTVTFPSNKGLIEKLFSSTSENQVGQDHNFICTCQETQWQGCWCISLSENQNVFFWYKWFCFSFYLSLFENPVIF